MRERVWSVRRIHHTAARQVCSAGARTRARYTTVASPPRRGVSVGSLYRYFSNEQAIQYRLQVDEWQKTGAALHTLSTDTSRCAR